MKRHNWDKVTPHPLMQRSMRSSVSDYFIQ